MNLEEQEQKTFVEYLDIRKIPYVHVPNGAYTPHRSVQNRNKALGQKAGFPDLIVYIPMNAKLSALISKVYGDDFIEKFVKRGEKYYMLHIEMKQSKKSNSKVSDRQKEWKDFLDNKVICTDSLICYGAEEAIETIEVYYPLKT